MATLQVNAEMQRIRESIAFHEKQKNYYWQRFSAYDRLRRSTKLDYSPQMEFYQELFNHHFNALHFLRSRLLAYETVIAAYAGRQDWQSYLRMAGSIVWPSGPVNRL